KGIATSAAKRLYPNVIHETEPASGEAIPAIFSRRVKRTGLDGESRYEDERIREAAVVSAAEFGSMAASGARSGSTLLPRLCSAFSGESLTFAKADADKTVSVDAGTYRLGLLTGIQFANAELMFSAQSSNIGVPQRFLWMPTNDPEAPAVRPEWPEPLTVRHHPPTVVDIKVCQSALDETDKHRLDVARGVPVDPHDEHKT